MQPQQLLGGCGFRPDGERGRWEQVLKIEILLLKTEHVCQKFNVVCQKLEIQLGGFLATPVVSNASSNLQMGTIAPKSDKSKAKQQGC